MTICWIILRNCQRRCCLDSCWTNRWRRGAIEDTRVAAVYPAATNTSRWRTVVVHCYLHFNRIVCSMQGVPGWCCTVYKGTRVQYARLQGYQGTVCKGAKVPGYSMQGCHQDTNSEHSWRSTEEHSIKVYHLEFVKPNAQNKQDHSERKHEYYRKGDRHEEQTSGRISGNLWGHPKARL